MTQKWNNRTVKALVVLICAAVSLLLIFCLVLSVGNPAASAQTEPADAGILDKFDMYMTNTISDTLDGVLSIDKVYWLKDDELVAPEPNQDCYGTASDPAELEGLLEEAADLIHGDKMYFDPQSTVLKPGSEIMYYHDETILAITWKEVHERGVYTYSEVFIAHPSQFRRFLAGGEYGSAMQFTTTEMAASVNAVVASSGDFYKFRNYGTIVYDRQVQRVHSWQVDTCFINDDGDLLFTYAGEIVKKDDAQKFVDENNIRFSMAFGPILVDNGEVVVPYDYVLGEVLEPFPRAALCQMGQLHYLVAAVNWEPSYVITPTIHRFAQQIYKTGCDKAYTLDGGQTAVIAMNDKLINKVHFGYQRQISDIFYFATAVPNGG